ncbi:MAG: sporulation transcription factor Spo0A [Oscillospiraceae bacterium]|nr:sporulation transcription factor Spo0A [Oscillospiraceae bacterium]
METKIKVLIADSSNDYRKLVANRFRDEPDMELVGSTTDGAEALRMAQEVRPDVIVLDVLLETLDGLDVLHRIGEMNLNVPCIVVSAFYKDSMISEALRLGASYFLRKPFGVQTLTEKIRHVTKRTDTAFPSEVGHLEFEVSNILRELGTPAQMKGYRFLRHGIVLTVLEVEFLYAVTGKLYPNIAEKFGASNAQVERCIRNVIAATWNDADPQILQKFFGYTISSRKRKPTNSEFIAMIADQLSLQQKYGDR